MHRVAIPFRLNVWQTLTLVLIVAVLLSLLLREPTVAQQPLAKPPVGQSYIGANECAACHFEQYQVWKTTPHAKAFLILPAKYQTDSSCLKCHTTGFGEPTGFKSVQQTRGLAGNTCENCHGPGSEHAKIAKALGQKKLSEQEQKYVRSTIYRMLPKNVCVECHLATSHKKHPPYDKQ